MCRKKITVIIVIAVLGFSLPGYCNSYSLIIDQPLDVPLSTQGAGLPVGFPSAWRSRGVALNPVIASSNILVGGDVITLNLFADTVLTAQVDRVSKNVNGTVTVRGRIEDYPQGYIIISTTNNNSLASIRIPETGERYRIQMDTLTGTHYLLEINTDQLVELEDCPSPIPPATLQNAAEMEISSDNIAGGPLDPANVDAMIVYTPAARQWADSYGGGIANVIAQAVAKGQLSLDNSNTFMTVTLVHSAEVSYTESGDSTTDLIRLTNTSDGYMDVVHTWRDDHGADVVGLFTKVSDVGGTGWLLYTPSGDDGTAFSITRVQQAAGGYTYIHEMGHNMGCHHHKGQNFQPGPGLFSYSAGWRWVGNDSSRYCSVMTYQSGSYFPDGQYHSRVPHFSNPSILYQGVATGHATDGDNARSIREVKHVIAGYRQSQNIEYCDASGGCSDSIPGSLNIDSVLVGDISNTGTGCDGYYDYTSLSTTMVVGQSYPITVIDGDPYDAGDQCGIWVDWNRDGDFSAGDETITVSGIWQTYTATITPPSGAAIGPTCMRIRIKWTGSISPCGTTEWGEVEDYTINVVPVPVTISGYVETDAAAGIEGVLMSASTGQTDTTDVDGYYELTFSTSWSGSITPTKDDWTFAPSSRDYVNVTSDIPNENFTGTFTPSVTISGYIETSSGSPVSGVDVMASSGGSDTTDIDGYYELTVPDGWTGTVLPILFDWTFDPLMHEYDDDVTSNLSEQNFIAAPSSGFGGGAGTESAPYLIYTAEQLQEIGRSIYNLDDHYRLMANINLSDYTGQEFDMIGFHTYVGYSFSFSGTFDGQGYKISNFTYDYDSDQQKFIGIFSYIDYVDAEVKNLTVLNANVDGGDHGVAEGALIGRLASGTVDNCKAEGGSVTGNSFFAGGLVGWNEGNVTGCYSSVNVTSLSGQAGGLVGENWDGDITSCSSTGNVTGEYGVGGLAGENTGTGNITSCSSWATVNGQQQVGGLVGENYGFISQSFSDANVVATNTEAGGLVGRNINGDIYDCFSNATVTGGSTVGGLVGLNWNATISNCYSTGYVTGSYPYGGLVGKEITAATTNSLWDTQTSGQTVSDGGTPKTTAEMQTQSTYTDIGWDFEGETANGTDDIWKLYSSTEYPRLSWEPYSGGTGTADDPYLIYTAKEMQTIAARRDDWDKHFKLMADISLADYTGHSYKRIGDSTSVNYIYGGEFRGFFDGNFHTISDFSYFATSSNLDNYIGLFGYVYRGTIKNLTLISPQVYTNIYAQNYVGPLIGCADNSDIIDCSVIGGSVDGEDNVGGLIGLCKASFISGCSSSASVSGTTDVGGLVGDTSTFGGFGRISDCYAHGNVTGDDYVGGFIGDSSAITLNNCYSTGQVTGTVNFGGFSGYNENVMPFENNVTSCFWDVNSSSEPNSAAGIGLPTAQMYDPNTFINEGWDFTGEMENGGSDDWAEPEGTGYPVLWHELTVLPPLPAFAGGDGTSQNPYLIETEIQLNSIGHNSRLMDKHFQLINDLDMSGSSFNMIAERPYSFSGTFFGEGHNVSNIQIERVFEMSYAGFIANLKRNALVKDLNLVKPDILSKWGWGVGALTGLNQNSTISNCRVVDANVTGLMAVGGLAGGNYSYGIITECSAMGNVAESNEMNFIFGPAGGLVGENSFWSEITDSRANCNVSGTDCLGGLVGSNLIYGDITNCYSQGSVSGTDYVGGLIGRNRGRNETEYSYSSSKVTGSQGTDLVGGFVGQMGSSGSETYTACFWDSDVNPGINGIGSGTDPNVTGLSTALMQTESTYTSAGWDFINTWDLTCESISYPQFIWEITPADLLCPHGVDFLDYCFLANHYGQTNCHLSNDCDLTDLDLSGTVDINDVNIFNNCWLFGK
ncbi:MAG: GLUG motif-containing protein [Planctomycetota bacterium]